MEFLVLLPYLLTGAGLAAWRCIAAGDTGLRLVWHLIVYFILGYAAGMVIFVLLLSLAACFSNKKKPQAVPNRFYQHIVTYVMGWLTALGRIRVRVRGAEKLPAGRWLLVGNHRSNYDPIVTGWALRDRGLIFVSKPENFRIPVVGRVLHKAGFLSIDRNNDRAALRTILAAAALLKQDCASVAIYPEGTRHAAAEMLPFRNGAFKIAKKAGVPIVIVAVHGTDEVGKNFPWRRTQVDLNICGVLDAERVRELGTDEIGEEVRKCITSADC